MIFRKYASVFYREANAVGVTGIVAEFNPLHKGHERLIRAIRESGDTVVCALSGNFVQRGDTAILPKMKRAEAALRCGVDLVAELQVCWSIPTAQNFALGGIAQLMALGCDRIAFGSECGNVQALEKTADMLSDPALKEPLAKLLATGMTFAKARQIAAEEAGAPKDILANPNDTLAVEYILAARKLEFTGTFFAFPRQGAAHDSPQITAETVSASLLREHLIQNDLGFAERYLPVTLKGWLRPEYISDIHRLETAVLAVLRTKTKDDFAALPDISEGLENKLLFCVQNATSLTTLTEAVKSKRYSLARIRRLILSAFLDIPAETFLTRPPYVRILGCSPAGENILQHHSSPVPVLTRAVDFKMLTGTAKTVFQTECRATDLYSLSLQTPQPCGVEYTMKFLKSE